MKKLIVSSLVLTLSTSLFSGIDAAAAKKVNTSYPASCSSKITVKVNTKNYKNQNILLPNLKCKSVADAVKKVIISILMSYILE